MYTATSILAPSNTGLYWESCSCTWCFQWLVTHWGAITHGKSESIKRNNSRWRRQTFHTRKSKHLPPFSFAHMFPCDLLWTWGILNICVCFACVPRFPQLACKGSTFPWPERPAERHRRRLGELDDSEQSNHQSRQRAAQRQMEWQAQRKHNRRPGLLH